MVRLFLDNGAAVNEKCSLRGNSALHWAAVLGLLDISELLISYGADVNAKASDGDTPLHRAVIRGHQIPKLLLRHGADVNSLNLAGCSAIFEAARLHRIQALEVLISHGAEINLVDEQGCSPLQYAFRSGKGDEVVSLLIKHGADINVMDQWSVSPLHIAAAQGNLNILELLLEHGSSNRNE